MLKQTKKPLMMAFLGAISLLGFAGLCQAQPFGIGIFDANVPFGSQTSLTIATDGNVNMPVTPSDSGTLATANSTITITSSDVVGYKLYVRSGSSTNLTNGAASITASVNGSPASLAVDTWGYNTDGSSNFVGLSLIDALIRTGTGPFTSGDATVVKYGVKVDNAEPPGSYSSTVVYTAVPQTN